ncbi:MAG TPA: DUF1573 domain-containing protein [Puia sp.]|nr:DUF1573 domain-containing protein [Puia sp.]
MRTFLACCLFTVLIASSVASCHSDSTSVAASAAAMADSTRFTTIQWLDSSYRDFGRIPEGQKLDVSFRFRNTGNMPLVIARVQPSCGCTIAEQPKAPIAPGAEGQIRATFNSEGRPGVNHKTLFVSSNTKGKQTWSLMFSVVVDKKS